MNKIIVYDSNHPAAIMNECFTESYASKGPGHNFTFRLYEEAKKCGIDVMTGDVFLSTNYDIDTTAFCISEMYSPLTKKLLDKGAIPFICMSMESPIIARTFYHNIARYAGKFIHSFQFNGTKERLINTPTNFHTFYFPITPNQIEQKKSWNEKKYLILVNSNKRAALIEYQSLKQVIRSMASKIRFEFFKLTDPWMRVREIYKDRIHVIKHFSKYDNFELYGSGWDNKIPGFGKVYSLAAIKSYRGSISGPYDLKLHKMSDFKFAICFENCSFPGYITEKIFDCFMAGCIPIYFGAPDIKNFIPESAFIDYSNFDNFDSLDKYLQNISEVESKKYINAARDFLQSQSFKKFKVSNVVGNMVDLVNKY